MDVIHGAAATRKTLSPLVERPAAPVLLCAILLVGCHAEGLRDRHQLFCSQIPYAAMMPVSDAARTSSGYLAEARACLDSGVREESNGCESCVDLYYRAALSAWQQLECEPAALTSDPDCPTAWQVYQESLGRLLATAAQYSRLDPRNHLIIVEGGRRRAVPIEYYGFAWKSYEFCQVLPASDAGWRGLQNYYRTCGLGVSLVAVRHGGCEELFYRRNQPFAVTAVLRPRPNVVAPPDGDLPACNSASCNTVLAFYNPCLLDSLPVGPTVVAMERDISAPFVYLQRESPRNFTEGFLDPDDAKVRPKLLMMEPYQPGKVPVVLIVSAQ